MVKIWITHIIVMILTPGIVAISFLGGRIYDIYLIYRNSDDEVVDDDDGNDDGDDDDKHNVMLW